MDGLESTCIYREVEKSDFITNRGNVFLVAFPYKVYYLLLYSCGQCKKCNVLLIAFRFLYTSFCDATLFQMI